MTESTVTGDREAGEGLSVRASPAAETGEMQLSSSIVWERTAPSALAAMPLQDELEVEFAVVGGGVAGLSTALHLAEQGREVVLLESGEVGEGATGKSGGLIVPDFIVQTPQGILRSHGQAEGKRLVRLVGNSAAECFALIERLDLACDAVQRGFLSPAHNEKVAKAQSQRAAEWCAAGYDVTFLGAPDVAAALGTTFYCGGLRFNSGGTVNPLGFCRGLASAAIAAGVRLCQASPVETLSPFSGGWRLSTSTGRVTARRVILAANGGNPALHPALQKTVLPLRVYEYATEPLSCELRRRVFPKGTAFTDRQPYLFTARYDGEGRLVSAFPDFILRRDETALRAEASRRIARYYPALAGIPIECLWSGTAWLNPSLLPEVYNLGEGVLAIQACNGRGLAVNAALGREVAAAMVNGDLGTLSVVPRAPTPVRLHALAYHLPALMMAAARVRSRVRAQLTGL